MQKVYGDKGLSQFFDSRVTGTPTYLPKVSTFRRKPRSSLYVNNDKTSDWGEGEGGGNGRVGFYGIIGGSHQPSQGCQTCHLQVCLVGREPTSPSSAVRDVSC